ncbi:MAG: hypothetical protein WC581_08145 [Thermodesulfovibrionales bacterium]
MKKLFFIFTVILVSLHLTLIPVFSADNKPLQIRKQPEIQQIRPKKPVKIKLKRTGEGKYTWDLTGDDVDELVRADKKLRKLLNLQ